jgi:hypothetical protein
VTVFTGNWETEDAAVVEVFLWIIEAKRRWQLFRIAGLFLAKYWGWGGCLIARSIDPLLHGMLKEEQRPSEKRGSRGRE